MTISIDTTIDVINKYQNLISESLGSDSIYIRMKETLEELLNDGEIKGTDRAKIISETIAAMSNTITANSMNTALQWAAQEKELVLKKTEMEYQLDVLAQQKEKLVADTLIAENDKKLKQAQLLRIYGTYVSDVNGDIVSLGDNGKEYVGMQNVIQDTANKALLQEQITSQTEEVQARTHKLVADTYVNHGLFTGYTITNNGIASATKVGTGFVTLSELQKQVAKEQAKGYAWNAWSSAASSSAGMLGTLVAADVPELVDDATAALAKWSSVVTKLDLVEPPVINI